MNSKSNHTIPSSPLTDALQAIYGTASALNEFMNSHIAALNRAGFQEAQISERIEP